MWMFEKNDNSTPAQELQTQWTHPVGTLFLTETITYTYENADRDISEISEQVDILRSCVCVSRKRRSHLL